MIPVLLCKTMRNYSSFTINKNLSFIVRFQFLSSSLDRLVKNLAKDDFNYVSQKFDNLKNLI